MKIFKIFLLISTTTITYSFMKYIYPLFMIYLNDVVLLQPYEIDADERLVAKKYIEKTYELKQDLFLVQFDQNSPYRLVNRFEVIGDEVVPMKIDKECAAFICKIPHGTTFTIKRTKMQALRFQGELPIPVFRALLVGHEDKGLVDVSYLMTFDYDNYMKTRKLLGEDRAILESTTPSDALLNFLSQP